MAGRKVSQSECAAVFGVHRNTVGNWLKAGCPFIQKANKKQGKDWILNTAEVAQWRAELAVKNAVGDTKDLDEVELRKRKLAAETTVAEIEAATRRGEVATIETIEKQWTDLVIEVRQRLMQVGKRSAASLVGMKDKREIQAVIEDEIEQCLELLANTSDESDGSELSE